MALSDGGSFETPMDIYKNIDFQTPLNTTPWLETGQFVCSFRISIADCEQQTQ